MSISPSPIGDSGQVLEMPPRRWIRNSGVLSVGIGIVSTIVLLLLLWPLQDTLPGAFFLDRGITQPFTLAIAITVFDYCLRRLLNSRRERRQLGLDWIPYGMKRLHAEDEDTMILLTLVSRRFTLIANRLSRVLVCFHETNSRAITRELHQDDTALTQADIEESFLVARTMIWVLPMLGFLCTVLGISISIGGFSGLLANVNDLEKVKSSLTSVTGGLSTAFDTTLLGIVCAVGCMVLMSIAEKSEYRLAVDLEASINDGFFPRLAQDEKT